jgi:predicted nucleic acid-binding protein
VPPAWAYFDTSVLVKRYVEEDGAAQAHAFLRRYRFLSSAILPVEAVAALGRRREAGDLSEADHTAILRRLASDRTHWELVDPGRTVLARAEQLAGRHGLRALDALHVASALEFETSTELRVPFITADRRQRDAAERSGLSVVWIGAAGRRS